MDRASRGNLMARQVMKSVWDGRWFMFVVGIWLQSVSGASYVFGSYSSAIKSSLNYDQQTLDLLGFFKDIGANVGSHAGILFNYVPVWTILLIGAIQCFFGYFAVWLAVTHRIASPPLWLMCIFICVATNAQTFFNTAVIVTGVETFPSGRGNVIGLQKGYLGLSGAILTQIYHALYGQQPSSFILMIAFLPAVIALLAAARIRPIPGPAEDNEEKTFNVVFWIALALAVYLVVVIILQNAGTLTNSISHWFVLLGVVVILLLPLAVVIRSEYDGVKKSSIHVAAAQPLLEDGIIDQSSGIINESVKGVVETSDLQYQRNPGFRGHETGSDDADRVASISKASVDDAASSGQTHQTLNGRSAVTEDFSILQALIELNFWLLFLCMACAMGSGLTAIDNLGQIGASLGYRQGQIETFVALLSIWNFLGRAGAGFISDRCLKSKGVARPVFVVITLVAMSVGHFVIASGIRGCLYVGSVVIGLCYGAQWALMPLITSDIFGLTNFGTLFNTIAIASPLGAYIFSVRVAGYFYDAEVRKQHLGTNVGRPSISSQGVLSSEALSCDGPKCFRLSFVIMAVMCLVGGVASSILAFRTRKFYRREFVKMQLEHQHRREKAVRNE